MSDGPLFQNADELEATYAPQQVPQERAKVVADEGVDGVGDNADVPAAAPVASLGSSHTGSAAPPNIGAGDPGTAQGDPDPQAEYPIGDNNRDTTR